MTQNGSVSLDGFPFIPGLYRWVRGGAYCVLAGRMRTAKSYLWLIQFKNQDVITPLLIFNSKVITFTHLFLGYISFLNLCRLFSNIGYTASPPATSKKPS